MSEIKITQCDMCGKRTDKVDAVGYVHIEGSLKIDAYSLHSGNWDFCSFECLKNGLFKKRKKT